MKILFLSLMILFSMSAYAQNAPSPPSTPQAGTTSKGTSYALSETKNSLAVSITFKEKYHSRILAIIKEHISAFNGTLLENDNSHLYEKIEFKKKSLKLEIRTKDDHLDDDFNKKKEQLLAIYNAILKY